MVWIFAAVAMALAVYSEGFRKFLCVCVVVSVLALFTAMCFIK
jgi:hypothetical protein